eukprot:scaffold24247_cov54-Attheya_sp.AAC.8
MMESILKCIQALVSCDATTTTSANTHGAPDTRSTGDTTPTTRTVPSTISISLADEIAGSMKGGLVARLVQCCLDPLQQPQKKQQHGHNHRQNDVRGNVGLQLQALSTLQSLLFHIPNVEMWRALLPGCFSDETNPSLETMINLSCTH